MLLEEVEGLTCTGNTMAVGRGDGGQGEWSPDYGIVCRGLKDAVVKDNSCTKAWKKLIDDEGGHSGQGSIGDNPGTLRVLPKP